MNSKNSFSKDAAYIFAVVIIIFQDREGATDSASRNFKGATMLELLSLTPCGFGYCYWKDRPGFPNIDPDIISRLQMPENL